MENTVLIAIKGGLSVIEKCLRDILEETKTNSQSRNWLLKERHSDISPYVATQLTSKAEEMLNEINELQKVFNVGKDTESVRWRIISDLTQVWTILSDLSPDGLRGYGALQPEESKLLTMHVDKMNAIRNDMERLLS
ncbi:MAG: hypothetical protein ABSD49_05880 [Candidatus Bathyarchaeia archaeon]|jgi:hypothetical protein